MYSKLKIFFFPKSLITDQFCWPALKHTFPNTDNKLFNNFIQESKTRVPYIPKLISLWKQKEQAALF